MTDHPFKTDPEGNIIAQPLVGYASVPVQDMFILMKLEYAESSAHLAAIMKQTEPPAALQLTITPDQADELSARLTLLANRIRSQATPSQAS